MNIEVGKRYKDRADREVENDKKIREIGVAVLDILVDRNEDINISIVALGSVIDYLFNRLEPSVSKMAKEKFRETFLCEEYASISSDWN